MTDAPSIGHNRGPIEDLLDPELITERLKLDHERLLSRRDELLAGVQRCLEQFSGGLSSEDDAGKVTDFVRQIKQASKDGEAAHKAAKAPYLNAGRAVDSLLKGGVADALMEAAKSVEKLLTAFAVAKADKVRREAAAAARQQREEADRLAAAAERTRNRDLIDSAIQADVAAQIVEKLAAGKSTDLSRTRGDHGGVVSLRDNWTYEVVDFSQVPDELKEISDRKTMARIKAGERDIPGLRIFNDATAIVR